MTLTTFEKDSLLWVLMRAAVTELEREPLSLDATTTEHRLNAVRKALKLLHRADEIFAT